MKLFKPKKPKKDVALVLYLSTFNTQSMAVTNATRVWAASKLIPNADPVLPR